ncbi:MAG: DUF3025 domain-containing protein [Burkholderiaceae bacterium]
MLNALVWLSFPRAKASLNAIQAGVIDRAGVAPSRGSTRDLATLFDENGAMLVTRERWIVDALAHHDWRGFSFGNVSDSFAAPGSTCSAMR